MNFLEQIETLKEQVSDDISNLKQKVSETLGEHLKKNPEPLFTLLREVKPIVLAQGFCVVTRFEDVIEVLDHPSEFNVPYGAKMKALAGDFILGLDNDARYEHDASALRLAVRRDDLDRIGAIVVSRTEEIVNAAVPSGLLDVVDLSRRVPARVIADYMGVPGPDEETLIEWAHLLFDEIFNNVQNDPTTARMAVAAGQEWRSYLDRLIVDRKAKIATGGTGTDDVLGRLLAMQQMPEIAFSDADIRNNLIGIMTGWIPTVSKAIAMALDNLLNRPQELSAAKEAACRGDIAMVKATMWEAMRFAPINPGLLRHCAVDYTLAKGTHRETMIPAGTTVFVATQSAMLDDNILDEPKTFQINRPSHQYLHFGWGLHTCFGQYINAVQIPLIAKVLLSQLGFRRAKDAAGTLVFQGNFPTSMAVAFGEEEKVGITFRETMEGSFALGETDPRAGEKVGEKLGQTLAMHATILINDINRFVSDAAHAGGITGHIDFPPFGKGIPSKSGVFNLFTPTDQPKLKQMIYELAFEHAGDDYYLAGHKDVQDDVGFDLWSDTTTLFTTLHKGTDKTGPVVGAGVLKLGVTELVKLASTLKATNAASDAEGAQAVALFGKFFLGELWTQYGKQ